MNIIKYYSVNNDCYKKNEAKADSRYTKFQSRGPIGLMLHSVGCSQPNAEVFAKRWNKSGYEVAVHAVLQADGTVYQCLPWNYRAWHCAGSGNNTHVGVEMTEPSCIKYTGGSSFTCSDPAAAKAQVKGTYETAVQLFAQLCTTYKIDPMTGIVSHKEGCAKGIASNHGDPEHLWKGLGMNYTMDTFRAAVKAAMNGKAATTAEPIKTSTAEKTTSTTVASSDSYRVKITTPILNVRKGPGVGYGIATQVRKGEVFTIVGESKGDGASKWGKLKSGAGWISLDYVSKM